MERLKIPLAAAIHDWGKFAQRTGLWKGDHAEIGATLVDKLLPFSLMAGWMTSEMQLESIIKQEAKRRLSS